MLRRLLPFTLAALLAAPLAACNGGGGGNDDDPTPDAAPGDAAVDMGAPPPDLAVDAALVEGAELSADVFEVPIIPPGQRVERQVWLANTGNTPFEITAFRLDAAAGVRFIYQFEGRQPVIAITDGRDLTPYPLVVPAGERIALIVEYAPRAAGEPSGELTVETSLASGGTFTVRIEAVDAIGEISAEPESVAFGRVQPGEAETVDVTVRNVGQAALTVTGVRVVGPDDFTVSIDGAPIGELDDPDGDGAPGLGAGQAFVVTVGYAPGAEGRDEATLLIESNDPETPTLRVPLTGNDTTGCILVEPADMLRIDFEVDEMDIQGEVTVQNCGGQPLTLDNVRFRPGTPPEVFSFPEGSLPEFPAELAPDELLTVLIDITPIPGDLRTYRGALQIMSNDPSQPQIVVELTAAPPEGVGEDDGM
ncbi:MAG: choice-of-anchor D domain-containing protein [bacterium]